MNKISTVPWETEGRKEMGMRRRKRWYRERWMAGREGHSSIHNIIIHVHAFGISYIAPDSQNIVLLI